MDGQVAVDKERKDQDMNNDEQNEQMPDDAQPMQPMQPIGEQNEDGETVDDSEEAGNDEKVEDGEKAEGGEKAEDGEKVDDDEDGDKGEAEDEILEGDMNDESAEGGTLPQAQEGRGGLAEILADPKATQAQISEKLAAQREQYIKKVEDERAQLLAELDARRKQFQKEGEDIQAQISARADQLLKDIEDSQAKVLAEAKASNEQSKTDEGRADRYKRTEEELTKVLSKSEAAGTQILKATNERLDEVYKNAEGQQGDLDNKGEAQQGDLDNKGEVQQGEGDSDSKNEDPVAVMEREVKNAKQQLGIVEQQIEQVGQQAQQVKVEGEKKPTAGEYVKGGLDFLDAINMDMLNLALATTGKEALADGKDSDSDAPFDTLADLKKSSQWDAEVENDNKDDEDSKDDEDNKDDEENKDNEENKGETKIADLPARREEVLKQRKGNLYKAVIIARILNPADAPEDYNPEDALKEQKDKEKLAEKTPSRFSRFMNSSKLSKGLDIAGTTAKTANAVSGLVGLASSDYKKSGWSKGFSIAADVMGMVGAVRGIIKKIKGFKSSKGTAEKALAIVGLVSDFSMVVAKIASLTKTIGEMTTFSKASTRAARIVTSAFTLLSQVTGMAGTCDSLRRAVAGRNKLKKAQEEEETEVRKIVGKAANGDVQGTGQEEVKEEESQEEKSQEEESQKEADKTSEDSQDKTLKQSKERRRLKKKDTSKKNEKEEQTKEEQAKNDKEELKKKAIDALKRPDITEDEKATLVSYLARDRVIAKKKIGIANISIGLITSVLGIGSTIAKEVSAETNPADQSKTNEAASTAANIFGGLSSAGTIASVAFAPIAGKIRRDNAQGSEEVKGVKEGLWGAVNSLGKDEYGLRRVAKTLRAENKPDAAKANEAKAVVDKYKKVEKQLDTADVDYNKLFEAKNQEEFKNSLVAGL